MLAIIALSPSHGTPGPPDGGKIWSNYLSLSHFQLFLHWKTISDVPADQLYMHSITVSCSSLWFHVWFCLCLAGVAGGHTLPDPNPPLFMTSSHRVEFTLLSLTWRWNSRAGSKNYRRESERQSILLPTTPLSLALSNTLTLTLTLGPDLPGFR